MPRLNNGLEVFKFLTSVTKYVIQTGTIGDTTTTSATTNGGTGANVTALTNFTASDPCFLTGSAGTELVTIGTPATTPMPMGQTLLVHPIGTRLVEAQAIGVGHIGEGGVSFSGQLTLDPIKAATSRTPIAYFAQPGTFNFDFDLLGWNNLNLQAAFGVTEGEIGAGSSGAPYGVAINGANIGNQSSLQGFRFLGTNNNAQTVQLDLMGASIEVNVNSNLGGTGVSSIKLSGKFTDLFSRIWT